MDLLPGSSSGALLQYMVFECLTSVCHTCNPFSIQPKSASVCRWCFRHSLVFVETPSQWKAVIQSVWAKGIAWFRQWLIIQNNTNASLSWVQYKHNPSISFPRCCVNHDCYTQSFHIKNKSIRFCEWYFTLRNIYRVRYSHMRMPCKWLRRHKKPHP